MSAHWTADGVRAAGTVSPVTESANETPYPPNPVRGVGQPQERGQRG